MPPEGAINAAMKARHDTVQGAEDDRFAGKDELDPKLVVLRVLHFLLKQLTFEFLTDREKASMDVQRDDLPDSVVEMTVAIVGRCWKLMTVATMGTLADCEKTMGMVDGLIAVWERHADANPTTFVNDTAGQAVMEIRLIVCRLLELQPTLLSSLAYQRLRPKLVRLHDRVAIQGLQFGRRSVLNVRSSSGMLPSPRAPLEVASSRMFMLRSPRKPGMSRENMLAHTIPDRFVNTPGSRSMSRAAHDDPAAFSDNNGRPSTGASAHSATSRPRSREPMARISVPDLQWMRKVVPSAEEDLLMCRVRSGVAPSTPRGRAGGRRAATSL